MMSCFHAHFPPMTKNKNNSLPMQIKAKHVATQKGGWWCQVSQCLTVLHSQSYNNYNNNTRNAVRNWDDGIQETKPKE